MTLLFRDDPTLRRCAATVTAVEDGAVRLDRTVFYATSGGQPGDCGLLRFDGGTIRVAEAVKGCGPEDILHRLADGATAPEVGTEVEAEIDWERRHRHMRMHTALHLMCACIEGDVTGGQIGAEKSRLDFNLPAGAIDKDALAERLNALVAEDHAIDTLWITEEELAAQPRLVRTLSVKPPVGGGRIRLVRIGPEDAPVDLQPCGGTHVARTREIGRLEVLKVENKGKQNRRVSIALAGDS